MKYAIVSAGVFVREAQDVNTVWDSTHYCMPGHLTLTEAALFNVVTVTQTAQPAFDAVTEAVVEADPVFDGTNWKQMWVKQALPAPQIAINQANIKFNQDLAAAKVYGKLVALVGMTPAQVQTWVAANVTNLTQAQDAIATLAIAVSILGRRL